MFFQSSFLFLAGFVQECSVLPVASSALGDSTLSLSAVYLHLVGSFCFSFAVFFPSNWHYKP